MLTISKDTLGWIILKAREFEVKDSDTSDNGEADEAGAMSVLEDRGDDASFDEVHSWIDDLTDTEQAELVALFWLGRGDGDANEFADLVQRARESRNTPTADYLLGAPLLSDMLEEGLQALGYSVSDIESDL
jgi:hypothetical protein